MTRYTSVQELLEHAAGADIPVAVDMAAITASGRSRVRRRRAALAALAVLAAAIVIAVTGGITASTLHGSGRRHAAGRHPHRAGPLTGPTPRSRATTPPVARERGLSAPGGGRVPG